MEYLHGLDIHVNVEYCRFYRHLVDICSGYKLDFSIIYMKQNFQVLI